VCGGDKMNNIKTQISNEINNLSEDLQKKVLDYIYFLENKSKGKSGKDLLKFAGIINGDDLRLIEKAIEEDCEKVDHGEW
jgi:hypothetical protein